MKRRHSIDISERNGVRTLHFGSRWVQGAMRIKRPFDLELAYARDMLFPLFLNSEEGWPRRILQIGLGAGSLAKWCYRYLPAAEITVLEIDARVYAAARQFFELPANDARLNVLVEDGVAWLMASDASWDLILLDGYDADGKSGGLSSLEFYQRCRELLSPRGVLSVNTLGLPNKNASGMDEGEAALHKAFEGDDGAVIRLPACESGNRIFLAGSNSLKQDLGKREAISERLEFLRSLFGLDFGRLALCFFS